MLSVALLALPESTPGSLYGLQEVLAGVGVAWSLATGEAETAKVRFKPSILSLDGKAITSPYGAQIAVEGTLHDADRPDIIIATDVAIDMQASPHGAWPEETAWLKTCHEQGAIVCAICTGSVFLAETGLLDGVEATTHWAAMPIFRDHYPAVILQPDRILCPAGAEHRIVTGGGASSWTDLALYLVARFAGEEEARRIAKLFVIGDRGHGQLPFAAMARPKQHDDAVIANVQTWVAENYATANPVGKMAERAGLAERTFARRFRKATGYAPSEYVQALRVEEAKQILETTDEPIDAIALMVGYAEPVSFRRLFKRQTGVTPARYRRRFSKLGALTEP
jgi:transcriptional regulator GlxA family with amidase domain